MSYARVESIDALRAFKSVLWKFADLAGAALADAEGELSRTLNWLETEQQAYWQDQIRKRTELVARAKDAVRAKRMFPRADGSRPRAVEEEKVLALAVRRLEEAHEKLATVRRYARQLQKEILLYNGQVHRLAHAVHSGIPTAAAHLDQLIAALESYVSLAQTDPAAEPVPSVGGVIASEPSTPTEAAGDAGVKGLPVSDSVPSQEQSAAPGLSEREIASPSDRSPVQGQRTANESEVGNRKPEIEEKGGSDGGL